MKKVEATKNKTVAFVCIIGHRSGLACRYAYMMGFIDVRNYDGGWYKWIQAPSNRPVETGEPKENRWRHLSRTRQRQPPNPYKEKG